MNEYANAWVKFVTKMWHQFCRFWEFSSHKWYNSVNIFPRHCLSTVTLSLAFSKSLST